MLIQQLRIARPVTDPEKSARLYCDGLGLSKIGTFTDHAGFSGCMSGREELPWHLEFTLCHQHPVSPSSSPEDLLVLYIPEHAQWQERCARMEAAGFNRVTSFNPYWDQNGVSFEDHDGYRVVLQNMHWATSTC